MHIASRWRVLLSRSCGPCRDSAGNLKGAPKLRWRDADHTAEDLCEMARTGVAHFQPHIYKAARSLPDQLLGAGNTLPRDELQRSHAGRLFENMGKVRRTQFHQLSETFD